MTEQRQRRIDTLNQAARRKSETKTKAAETAIRTLVKRGEPVTFQAVQRTAGVSHSFLYTHPALRERIEHLRRQNRATEGPWIFRIGNPLRFFLEEGALNVEKASVVYS
jgi:predicted Zn-dependent protease